MIILCTGIYRTGTTYQFNVLRIIMELRHGKENVYSCYVGNYDSTNDCPVHIVKVTKPNAELLRRADYVFTTKRNKEETIESMKRRAQYLELHPDSRFVNESKHEYYNEFKKWLRFYKPKSCYTQSFNKITKDPKGQIKDYLNVLNIDLDPETVLKKLQAIKVPTKGYSRVTLLHEGHITKPINQ